MATKNKSESSGWKNPPTVDQLKKDITLASTYHGEHVNNLLEWEATLKGSLNKKIPEGRSRLQPLIARKHGEWRYPSLENPFLSSPDLFDVYPATHADVEAARQNALILNKQFSTDIPRVDFINNYVRTAVNTGTAIIKVSWESREGTVREVFDEPVYAQSQDEKIEFLYTQVQQGIMKDEMARSLAQSDKQIVVGSEKVLREVTKLVVNRPVLEVKDSANIFIDPTCRGDIHKANFIVDVFVTDLATLTRDGRYTNLDKIDVSGHSTAEELDVRLNIEEGHEFEDTPRRKLVVKEYWGYWDINDEGTLEPIVATFVDDIMIRLERNPYPDGELPFVIVKYIPSTDLYSVYGEPDVALLKDNQDIIGVLTRGIIDSAARAANAQKGVARGLMDNGNLLNFKAGKDFVFNPMPGGWEQNYIQTSYPDVPKGAIDLLTLQSKEAESLTAVVPFVSNGMNSQSLGTSATGIKSTLDATAKREASILHRLSQGLIDIGKKIISMNGLWLTDEEIIRITDDEFVTISRASLAGQFDLRITISTAEEDEAKAQELAFMLQTIGNNTDFGIVKMILVKIAELRKLPDLAKAIKDYEPQPDPVQQQLAQKQMQLLDEQIRELQVKSAENMADIELKREKTALTAAQTRNLNSNSDVKDVEYLNDVTGLKHSRELEQIEYKEKFKQEQAKMKADAFKVKSGKQTNKK